MGQCIRYSAPSSLVLGYWMCGAYLMAIKRYAEYRMIGDKETAGKYRKSFKYYYEKTLMISSFFYAMFAVFLIGVFLTKYRIEMILFMPFLCFLFCYYFMLSYESDSAVQKPEKLFKEKGIDGDLPLPYCRFYGIDVCRYSILADI